MTYQAYATPAQLAAYLDVSELELVDADRLLLRASTLIDTIPTLVPYSIDETTGIPIDGDAAIALARAASAQVEFWYEIGGDVPNVEGESHDILRLQGDQKIGKVSIPSPPTYAPRMLDELRSVGLINSGVAQGFSTVAQKFFEGDC